MSVRQYIGARYVPLFMGEWDETANYEPLSVVINQGNSYTSRQSVPAGIPLTNETYWAETGNYNAQIEQYRQEVLRFDARIAANVQAIADEVEAREALEGELSADIASEALARGEADTALQQAIDAEAQARQAADDALSERISTSMRDLSWNCRFRQIIGTNYDLSQTHSAQGMTIYELGGTRYLAQSAILDQSAIIIYDYDANVEVARISGNYGHINDLTYLDGVLYALNEQTSTLYKFNVTASSIAFGSSEVLPFTAEGIHIADDRSWYVAIGQGQGLGVRVYHYDADFGTELQSYFIPYKGLAMVQGISVNNNAFFVALTAPNTLVYYNIENTDWYFISVPQYIGHCLTDEVEGVYFDDASNVYFSTNSTVDLQVLATVFESNFIHNVEKEVDSSVDQNRYGVITAKIDASAGDLVAPGEFGHVFRLAGDAINYAKSLGNPLIRLDFLADYPYPIVASGSCIQLMISDASLNIGLNGLYATDCKIIVTNVNRFTLNPVNIPSLVYDGIAYGAYCNACEFDIGTGTWKAPSPAYDATRRKAYFNNCTVRIQETTYYRFYNCILAAANTTQASTSTYERTAMLAHATA